VLEASTGRIIALLEGSTLTAIRTGAASGAATDLLARPDSKTAAIFGAGVQGRTQLEAICAVREIETVWIVDPDSEKAHTFVDDLAGHENIPTDLRVTTDPEEAASLADIICTATTSLVPVYPVEAIRPGTHINGVGSYTLEMIENPPEIYSRACAFVDSREAVLAEAGETVAAVNRKLLFSEELAELGEVILGERPGRISEKQITFFKSVGVAVQDALAAQHALQNALEMGLGQRVTW
jgi:ornithine cyclodeaminase